MPLNAGVRAVYIARYLRASVVDDSVLLRHLASFGRGQTEKDFFS